MANVYEIITNKFVESLEQGRIPWQKPWSVGGWAFNYTTGKPYSLINQMLLAGGEYLSFQQVTNLGGKVKKGEKGSMVISYFEKVDKDEDGNELPETKRVLPRYYYVFEVSQCEGIEPKRTEDTGRKEHEVIEEAKAVMDSYFGRETVKLEHHMNPKAFYRPATDTVVLPEMSMFKTANGYYGTAFHTITIQNISDFKNTFIQRVYLSEISVHYCEFNVIPFLITSVISALYFNPFRGQFRGHFCLKYPL